MKESLRKKIKSYSAFVAVLLAAKETDAQIIYTDVNPDKSLYDSNDHFNLDLNNDGVFDFRFKGGRGDFSTGGGYSGTFISSSSLSVTKLGKNSVLGSPDALNLNDTIDQRKSWSAGGRMAYSYWRVSWEGSSSQTDQSSGGEWLNLGRDGYLGLKIIAGGKTYYGWARIEGDSLKDYAYNIQPDKPILAGQKSLCLPPVPTVTGTDSTANQIKLTACPATGYSYQWKLNGQNISGATSAEYIAKETGNFTVEITDKGGCSNNSDVFSFVSGINDISVKGNSFQSFLSNRTLFIKEIPQKFIGGELQVFDVTGRKSAGQTITGSSEQLHLSSLSDGLYILELSKSGLKERRKFVLN
ncbi:MAG: T9SS type A sorting domain-containing protein [Bacteroidia bacterium]|nr:T9SS type A sorting domain-containing protein [Bacteroidia bacterium]